MSAHGIQMLQAFALCIAGVVVSFALVAGLCIAVTRTVVWVIYGDRDEPPAWSRTKEDER